MGFWVEELELELELVLREELELELVAELKALPLANIFSNGVGSANHFFDTTLENCAAGVSESTIFKYKELKYITNSKPKPFIMILK